MEVKRSRCITLPIRIKIDKDRWKKYKRGMFSLWKEDSVGKMVSLRGEGGLNSGGCLW